MVVRGAWVSGSRQLGCGIAVALVAMVSGETALAQTRAQRLAAQQQAAQQAAQQAPAPAAAASAPAGPNPVTAALQKAGVQRCSAQIQKVTNFFTTGAKVGTTVFPAASNPDDSLISISSEIQAGNVLTYASANFAPRADGCSAEYEQVTHWQNTCEQVYAAQFTAFKAMGVIQAVVRVYYNTPGTRIMMVPTGTGCVVIKKEVLH